MSDAPTHIYVLTQRGAAWEVTEIRPTPGQVGTVPEEVITPLLEYLGADAKNYKGEERCMKCYDDGCALCCPEDLCPVCGDFDPLDDIICDDDTHPDCLFKARCAKRIGGCVP